MAYAELAVSFPAVAEAIASAHYIYPWRDGLAEWPGHIRGWYTPKGHQSVSSNEAQHSFNFVDVTSTVATTPKYPQRNLSSRELPIHILMHICHLFAADE